MFLKRLELSGFKSFADRTELEFVRGITGVVGPNGSGKSNISDSIRWVLGEQSAKSLRGGNMQDVIFAGSDSRKAVNYGEVSLTLDNSDSALALDFNEVTITRRIHRSGESEYYINKQACRLKDITELFMDTGIGKEAYSIIGQGRIEEILSTKSEDRRGIFEEASGIVKYKSRKREAEKKLADTEQNLLRIHDLVSELEDQLEPLARQSEKAVRFKELKEQLKSLEIALYVYQIEQLSSSWEEQKVVLERLRARQLELSAVVGKHDAQLETQRHASKRLEEEVERLQEELLLVSGELEKGEGQSEVLKERQKYLTGRLAELEQAIEAQEARAAAKDEELRQAQAELAELSGKLSGLEAKLREEELRLLGVSRSVSDASEEELKARLIDTLSEMAQKRNEARYAEQQLEQLARRLERLEEELSRAAEQADEAESGRRERREQLDGLQRRLIAVRDEYARISQSAKSRQATLTEAEAALRKWEQRLDGLRSRRETMLELQNDYDGFAYGVKEVLKSKQRGELHGIHGAVAELLRVPAELETAVETALGGALQHIVVETERDGREAIAFLKRRQAGRATFLPLDVIRGRSVGDMERRAVAECAGFVGVAVDLIGFDAPYRSIAENLLGTVLIAEKLEDANRIASRCQYRYRVVTLDGDVVNPGGSMTGGSQVKKTANLLGRQRQIEELAGEIAECEAQLAKLRQQTEQVRNSLLADNKRLEELRTEGETLRVSEQQLLSELSGLESQSGKLSEQTALLRQDAELLREESRAMVERRDAAEKEAAELTKREAELQQAIREAEAARKASESLKEELQEQLTAIKVQVASATQEKRAAEERVNRLAAERAALVAELADHRDRLAVARAEIDENARRQSGQTELLNELRLRKQKLGEQLERKRAERSEWMKQLELAEDETREQRNELKRVEDELHQTEIKVNRLDVELDNLLKKLSEDYEIGIELAKRKYPVPEDVPAAQQKVRELKREISLLGEVNLGAIEEYQRVSERYEFLNGQKNDLIEAKTALYQVIRELDEEMSKRFKTTFDQIRTQFAGVFTKLFGGGRADLVLTDPSQPLDSGIEIIAQPPGKKLQNLQLLSGGERALTAIGLLFAILRIKPVPFCVLDEVEAALDEANVARFAQYLREFSAETQFIVVTHRKGTMEEADVLYGVTMEEGGVSKLVSVRLDDERFFKEEATA
ncbi:chromosome segregation protein SMC [Paenibacillus thermoaerophilus]|uniref:Chromosome partition protein Smc n=1 Tax=Paenibacillus thermoaerophilus TaxID=1215385 RepID=A0ABW2V1Z4_9BACL|nr:chromosome segregation protein SMC [Paenibacillus thermoaerophilus]TMV19186.1 chromosome segregation protein SMC [Paenibacillus thermoaerophilus]